MKYMIQKSLVDDVETDILVVLIIFNCHSCMQNIYSYRSIKSSVQVVLIK